MKEVCKSAYYFEDGSNQWKPNAKTAEGFIRTCKKALEEAKETDGKMPYYLSGIIYWEENRSKFNEAIEIFSGKENISIKQRYSCKTIETENIETYIKAKQTLDSMRKNYLESDAHNIKSFKEWFEENKTNWRYFRETVTA